MTIRVIASALRFLSPPSQAVWAAALLASLFAGVGRSAEPRLRPFNLPAESADKSLKRFSVQSGLEVIFSSRIAKGVTTREVKGEMVPEAALKTMLADTGLVAVQEEKSRAISVRRETEVEKNGARAASKKKDDRPTSTKPKTSPEKR